MISLTILGLFFLPTISSQSQTTQTSSHGKGPTAAIIIAECRVNLVHELSLSCERSGILDYVVKEGATIKQGEVIIRLRDALAKSNFLVAERESANDIEIRFAKKAGELAQLKYERAQQAEQAISGTVTDFELRELRLAAERSLLQLQQAEHLFEISNLRKREQLEILKSHQLAAPFDAFVRVATKQAGEYVREGEVVLEIINDQLIQIDGFVDVADLPTIAIGNEVAIQLNNQRGAASIYRGRVSFVDSKIEPVSMKARVSAQVPNTNSNLKAGLLVTMAITPTAVQPSSPQ